MATGTSTSPELIVANQPADGAYLELVL